MKDDITQNEWNSLHDVIIEATWEHGQISMATDELKTLFDEFPREIKGDVFKWGLSDTVVRDNIYLWYIDNKL